MPELSPHFHVDPRIGGAAASELWRTVAMHLPDCIVAVNRNGDIVWVNRPPPPQSRDDVLGKTCRSFLAPSAVAAHEALLAAVFRGGTPENCEIETNDGRWWLCRAVPIFATDGQVQLAVLISTDITERKRAQEALAEKEQLFHLIADTSPAVTFIYDHVAGGVVYVNSRVRQLMDYSPSEIIALGGEFASKAIHADDLGFVSEHVEALQSMSDGEVREIEYRLLRRDGSECWVSSRTTPFRRAADGTLIQTLCATVDLAERMRFEAELDEQRRLLDHVIRSLPAVTVVWDLQQDRPLYVNGRTEELFDCTSDDLFSLDPVRKNNTLPRSVTMQLIEAIRAAKTAPDGESVDVEHEVPFEDGRRRFILSRVSVMRRDANGAAWLLSGMLLDITERREAKARLKASEARLRSVMTHVPDLIVRLDAQGNVSFINRPTEGLECEKNVQANAFAWVAAPDAHLLRQALHAVFAESRTAKARLRARLRDGAERVYDCRFGPIVVGDEVESAIVIAHDATAEIHTLNEIRRKESQLAHAMELSTSAGMIAGISHEVGQPIYSITNFAAAAAQTLSSDKAPDLDLLREWIGKIKEQSIRVGDIIRGLRDLVRGGEPVRVAVDLNEVVREGIHLSEQYLRQAGLRVQFMEYHSPVSCLVDRVQYEQVLVNLLRNAADAMEECPTADRVLKIAVSRTGDEGRISIMDRGKGLPAGREAMIFEPFFTTKSRGLGLGLAICRNVVSSHGGRLWAERNVGAGATFHITLPLAGDS